MVNACRCPDSVIPSGVPEGIACGKAAKDSMTRQRAAERIEALLSAIATCTPFVILLLSS